MPEISFKDKKSFQQHPNGDINEDFQQQVKDKETEKLKGVQIYPPEIVKVKSRGGSKGSKGSRKKKVK